MGSCDGGHGVDSSQGEGLVELLDGLNFVSFQTHHFAGNSIRKLALETKLPRQFESFGQRADPGINGIPLGLELLALVPQTAQRHVEHLDKLILLELWLEVLVLGEAHVDGDVNHDDIGVAEARI